MTAQVLPMVSDTFCNTGGNAYTRLSDLRFLNFALR